MCVKSVLLGLIYEIRILYLKVVKIIYSTWVTSTGTRVDMELSNDIVYNLSQSRGVQLYRI